MKSCIALYLTRTVTDTKTGKVIKRYRKRLARSFVKAFMQLLESGMAHAYDVGSDAVGIIDTGNTSRPISFNTNTGKLSLAGECPSNLATYGIQIGTGITAPDVSDYTIETQIAHGSGAGQMEHGATSVQQASVSGAKMEMTIVRAFINSSGGAITVKEVGMALNQQTFCFLIIHDAIDDLVNDGQTYTVTYTLETTV